MTPAHWSAFLVVAAAARAAADSSSREPTLIEAQDAAARVAAGTSDEDASRLARARASHWAPVVRGQIGGRDDSRFRDGTYRDAPIRWQDTGDAFTWGVSLTWDLPQAIFARDETQLVHSQIHASRARLQAATETARLFLERREKKRALASLPGTEVATRARLALEILRATAELDARTGGLFREALEREQREPPPSPPAPPLQAPPPPAPQPSLNPQPGQAR